MRGSSAGIVARSRLTPLCSAKRSKAFFMQVSIPKARTSNFMNLRASISSLSHSITCRSIMAAGSIGTRSSSRSWVRTNPPGCWLRWRGAPTSWRARSSARRSRHFGKAGSWYYEIARGQDDRPVQADRERKLSGSETTFSEDLIDPVQIEAGVIAMADDVWAWCEKVNARGRTVTVKIKWADFQISTRSRSMETKIQTGGTLHQLALCMIRSVFPPPKGIRLVGVTLSNFQAQSGSEAAELPLS